MIGSTNATASKNAFAIIDVFYTAGAVCTVHNQTTGKTITARDTTGAFTFFLPNPGTWTITAVLGQNTKTETVSVEYFEHKTVRLAIPVYLYKDGVELEAWGLQDSKASKGASSINISIDSSNTLAYYSSGSKFTITAELTTIHATFHVTSHGGSSTFAALFLRGTVPVMSDVNRTDSDLVSSMGNTWTNGNDYTIDLDITSLTGQALYVLFGARYTCNIDLKRVWFD